MDAMEGREKRRANRWMVGAAKGYAAERAGEERGNLRRWDESGCVRSTS